MRRRHADLHASDWVDVYCSVCHRLIRDHEWRDEAVDGTTCVDCHHRLTQMEDGPEVYRSRYRDSISLLRGL